MSERTYSPSTRRDLLVLCACGIGAIAGCVGGDATEQPVEGAPPQNESEDDPDEGTSGKEELTLADDDPWESGDRPAGVPPFQNDQNWRSSTHDAGNTRFNPAASDIRNEPQLAWEIEETADGAVPPLVVDGNVYLASGSELLEIDTESAETRTVVESTRGTIRAPVIADGRAFVQGSDQVSAYDLLDGTEQWSTALPTPGYAHELQVTADHVIAARQEEVVAFDRADGRRLWSEQLHTTQFATGGRFPLLADGVVVPNVGTAIYDTAGNRRTELAELFDASLAAGHLYAIDRSTEQLVAVDWTDFETEWVQSPEEYPFEVGVSEDRVVTAGATLTGFDRSTGEQLWEREASALPVSEEFVTVGLITGPDLAYVTGQNESVFAVDCRDGTVQWAFERDSLNPWRMVLAEGLLVVTTRDGSVLALE